MIFSKPGRCQFFVVTGQVPRPSILFYTGLLLPTIVLCLRAHSIKLGVCFSLSKSCKALGPLMRYVLRPKSTFPRRLYHCCRPGFLDTLINRNRNWKWKWSRSVLSHPLWPHRPGSSAHGILQARTLEWVAISSSRVSSWPRDQTWVSWVVSRRFYCLSHQGSLKQVLSLKKKQKWLRRQSCRPRGLNLELQSIIPKPWNLTEFVRLNFEIAWHWLFLYLFFFSLFACKYL